MLKQHIAVDAFVQCARVKGIEKTLFGKIEDTGNIILKDLQQYLNLVCGMFSISPIGDSAAKEPMEIVNKFSTGFHVCLYVPLGAEIEVTSLSHIWKMCLSVWTEMLQEPYAAG